jgi:hypothetical protein
VGGGRRQTARPRPASTAGARREADTNPNQGWGGGARAVRHGAPSAVAGTARGGVAAAPVGAEQADDVGVRRQPLVQLELVAHRVAALAAELRARALLDHDLGPARLVLRPVDRAARGAVELLEQHEVLVTAVDAKLRHGRRRSPGILLRLHAAPTPTKNANTARWEKTRERKHGRTARLGERLLASAFCHLARLNRARWQKALWLRHRLFACNLKLRAISSPRWRCVRRHAAGKSPAL